MGRWHEVKEDFLKLLKEDEEFKYAVLGYLGMAEVLKRLDGIEAEQRSLREEQVNLRKEQASMRKEMRTFAEELVKLREEQAELRKEQIKLREDFNEMLKEIRSINIKLGRVERTLEKLTLDIEEEARSIIKYRLSEMSVEVDVGRLSLPDLEVNVYGANDEMCVIGEATVRAGLRTLDDLMEKLGAIERKYPELLRRRKVLLIYASLAMPELIERAKKEGVWVLRATGDVVPPALA